MNTRHSHSDVTWPVFRILRLIPTPQGPELLLSHSSRQWHPTPVLLPGKSHGQRSLEVHGVTEGRIWLSDFTFPFHFHALEKEMATHSSVLAWRIPGTGGSWWAAVSGVAQSRTWLKRLSSSSSSISDECYGFSDDESWSKLWILFSEKTHWPHFTHQLMHNLRGLAPQHCTIFVLLTALPVVTTHTVG